MSAKTTTTDSPAGAGSSPSFCSPSLQLALAELADWAQIEAKAADSKVSQDIWLQVRDWAQNGARSSKTPKVKHPLPPDTDILEALEARIPGIIAIGARWARKANGQSAGTAD